MTPAAILTVALVGFGCARNNDDNAVGAARDTSSTVASDSVHNQTESGVTDSSGQSTLGTGVEKTRPDQGQPVTSKGDTINPGVDSATTGNSSGATSGSTTTGSSTTDTSSMGNMSSDTSSMGNMSSDSSGMGSMSNDSSSMGNMSSDSSTTSH